LALPEFSSIGLSPNAEFQRGGIVNLLVLVAVSAHKHDHVSRWVDISEKPQRRGELERGHFIAKAALNFMEYPVRRNFGD
jgi:hypothetical protein